MKRILILLTILSVLVIKTWGFVHVVEKGETLESIAETYSIPTAVLIKANPGCEKGIHIGLKLQIPMSQEETQIQPTPTTNTEQELMPIQTHNYDENQNDPEFVNKYDTEHNASQYHSTANESQATPGFDFCLQISYGFLKKEVSANGTCWAYAATVGANYYIFDKGKGLFAGARIGYDSGNSILTEKAYGEYLTVERTSHLISLPINVGYKFSTESAVLSFTPYVGFNLGYAIKSTNKIKGTNEKLDYEGDKFGLSLRAGLAIGLSDFNIIGFYDHPLNKPQKAFFGKHGYFGIGIGFGF